jgi:choline dehydrogenase-like flavoprotein
MVGIASDVLVPASRPRSRLVLATEKLGGITGKGTVRDVIVVGAGGGGPVVAKELAARGLDVLLLEAGAAFEHSERDWSHHASEANNPATGIFRFGPSDRKLAPWARDLPQNSFVWQTAGVGGSTVHYFGNSPRAMPGVFSDYAGGDASSYDREHAMPFGYRELIPYYEWVEHTLPVQTAAMGTKEERFLRAAEKLGWKAQTSRDISGPSFRPQENAILQPDGTAGRTADRRQLVYPRARGCTFCGHCPQGCVEPVKSPRNLRAKRSTHTSYVPMALTADRWTHGKGGDIATRCVRDEDRDGRRRSLGRHVAERPHRRYDE